MKTRRKLFLLVLLLLVITAICLANALKKTVAVTQPLQTQANQEIPSLNTQQPSGDATVTLFETINKPSVGMTRYLFKASDNKTNITKTIFEAIEDSSITYSIPENAWSPDNKQFFLIKTISNVKDYLVFKADNSNYANGQKFLDIGDYWSKSKFSLNVNDVTGWAGDDLLVFTTSQSNGANGQLFWFVISSNGFLPLSR